MSQHDYVIANDSGASVRADINSALQAILSQNSGTSEPTSTSAGTLWLDTTGGAPYTLKIRDAGNNHWLTIASVTDPGSDGNIETNATIKGTIDSTATFPNGHILQVVNHTSSTSASGTGDVTAVSGSITLSSATNKILALGTLNWNLTGGHNTIRNGGLKLVTSGTGVTAQTYLPTVLDGSGSYGLRLRLLTASSDYEIGGVSTAQYLFSPAYAGSVTVTLFGIGYGSSYGTMLVNRDDGTTDGTSSLTLIEVKA